jgi:hypothetical protein
MKMTLDTISWQVVAPGAAGVAATIVAGDSPQVRSTGPIIGGNLIALWSFAQANGFTQVLFPYGHDMSRNIRYRNIALQAANQLGRGIKQPMKSQDLITVTQAGSATAGDVETIHALIAYPELDGGSDKYITFEDFQAQCEEIVTIEDTITATVAATYSGARALNAVTTTLKANRNYAVIGAQIGIACGALTIRGQDTGNLRASIPGNPTLADATMNWFPDLASWKGLPLIPVINAANQANTFLEIVQNENLVAVPFSLTLALLEDK